MIKNECNRSGYIDFIEILILMDNYLFGDQNKLQLFLVIYLESYIHKMNCVQKVFISVIKKNKKLILFSFFFLNDIKHSPYE